MYKNNREYLEDLELIVNSDEFKNTILLLGVIIGALCLTIVGVDAYYGL